MLSCLDIYYPTNCRIMVLPAHQNPPWFVRVDLLRLDLDEEAVLKRLPCLLISAPFTVLSFLMLSHGHCFLCLMLSS